MNKNIIYINSDEYLRICNQHPKILRRASVVYELIETYELIKSLEIVAPVPASKSQLALFHSDEYINFLEEISTPDFDESLNEDRLEESGLTYDCSAFPEIFTYARYVAGATLTAVKCLANKQCDIAINLNGGWHHARSDEASGFCFVNDVVIGILELMKSFKRILYIDLDCHHGDAVEEAFHFSKKVLTFSIHKFESGFFPGSGELSNRYEINAPLKSGLRDGRFFDLFQTVYIEIMSKFQPDMIVCQCGADCVSGDPLGGFNLSERAIPKCVSEITKSKVPLLILGGGGYNLTNTARCWAALMGELLRKNLSDDIPDHRFLDLYKPDYCLHVSISNRKDENTLESIAHVIDDVMKTLDSICVVNNKEKSASSENTSRKRPLQGKQDIEGCQKKQFAD